MHWYNPKTRKVEDVSAPSTDEEAFEMLRAKQPETKVCPMCDTEFTAKRKDAKYCSPACRQRHHRMWKSLG